ncbi:MAG: hypothetical protein CVT79_10830 [Alphaproteobacteria bacterium HGW-Alphaproteobacteria-18]|nr:MAG: hypothetical protein CVT79_10830 [Alphaproteobacteria bacterium HGW-Alphaproteobacteria-18]
MANYMNTIRFVGALLAFAAFAAGTDAEGGCNRADVAQLHGAALRTSPEARPTYFKLTSDTFLSDCPNRAEAAETRLIVARKALESGHAVDAVAHYEDAILGGATLSHIQRLDQSVALLASGMTSESLEVRNLAINTWLEELSADGTTRFDVRKSQGGVVLAVSFPHQDPSVSVYALWLAIPDGPGLPAAAILRPAPMRASLQALRTGRQPAALTILEQRTCQDARILRETLQPAAIESFDRVASEAMRTYLRRPDGATGSEPAPSLAGCLMSELMLPVPEPGY